MRYDVVIIGGGLAGITAALRLKEAGKKCIVVSEGLSLHPTERAKYIAAGGAILPGDSVIAGEFEGNTLRRVFTRNLGATALEADNFVLATGKFFSKGLVSTMDGIAEPIFGCDVLFNPDRTAWVNPNFFAPQPFEQFGVKTDEAGRVSIQGRTVSNLYAAGEVLAGSPDIVNSALEVCRNII